MKIVIVNEFIKLGQLLKKLNLISSGGESKRYLQNNVIKINDKIIQGRNTKIKVNSTILINSNIYYIIN